MARELRILPMLEEKVLLLDTEIFPEEFLWGAIPTKSY